MMLNVVCMMMYDVYRKWAKKVANYGALFGPKLAIKSGKKVALFGPKLATNWPKSGKKVAKKWQKTGKNWAKSGQFCPEWENY